MFPFISSKLLFRHLGHFHFADLNPISDVECSLFGKVPRNVVRSGYAPNGPVVLGWQHRCESN